MWPNMNGCMLAETYREDVALSKGRYEKVQAEQQNSKCAVLRHWRVSCPSVAPVDILGVYISSLLQQKWILRAGLREAEHCSRLMMCWPHYAYNPTMPV